MRNLLLTIAIIFFAFAKAKSQNTEPIGLAFNLYSGYVFQNKIDAYYDNNTSYNGKIDGGYQWGGSLEYTIKKLYSVEASYLRQNTHTSINYSGTEQPEIVSDSYRSTYNYLMFGGNAFINSRWDNLKPYGGLMIGLMVHRDFQANNNITNNKFAWGLKLGTDYMLSDNFILKLQGSVVSALQTADIYPSLGVGGTLDWYTDYRSLIQYSITAGVGYLF